MDFADLFNDLLIGQSKPLHDEERTKCHPYRLCWSASRRTELKGVCSLQLFPWKQGGEEHPAIIRDQCAAKKQKKIIDSEITVIEF